MNKDEVVQGVPVESIMGVTSNLTNIGLSFIESQEERVDMEVPINTKDVTVPMKTLPNLDNVSKEKIQKQVSALDSYCMMCGVTGESLPRGVTECPECHRVFKNRMKSRQEVADNIYIPAKYRDEEWDIEKAKMNRTALKYFASKEDRNFYLSWVEDLARMLDLADKANIFRDSYILSAPDGLGKKRFVFTLMRHLYRQKIKTSPMIQVTDFELSNYNLSQEGLLILYLTRYNFQENLNKLDHILMKRKLLDLPVLVVTSVPYGHMKSEIDNKEIYFDTKLVLG